MPHFIIECSENILEKRPAEYIMSIVYNVTQSSGLFVQGDIKVRLHSYKNYMLGENKTDFIHIFSHIIEGRSTDQKAELSKQIIANLKPAFPDISFLSINIYEFEFATYSNRGLINPDNTNNDRYFELH